MSEGFAAGRTYGDADGYDSYMGAWSAALAPLFLRFVEIAEPASVLDLGCGTGNLLAALAARSSRTTLVGVDPSTALLAKARRRSDLGEVRLVDGAVESLPFENGAFDYCLSLLVLQEFPDRLRALGEMRRVTQSGGIVAACQWHFSRMPVINALVEAINEVNPIAGGKVSRNSPRVFANEAELLHYWTLAGFSDPSAGRVTVTRTFLTFEHLWLPLIAGSTPSTLTLASLSAAERNSVRSSMQRRFGNDTPDAPLQVTAEALVVKGRA